MRPSASRGTSTIGSLKSSTSLRKSSGPRPSKHSTASKTSSALPTARPVTSLISLSIVKTSTPISTPTAVIPSANVCGSSRVFIKAPVPYFTSRTSLSNVSAIFFDMIEAVISAIDGTVPVTSRRA